ncbi:hypothetical protein BDZ91DRAFT_797573 [Kalaharituber pfeilii]|nr:hypothetical protein BDZ91DRAFT_797573 [Kalaharituber pfeilii]
MAIQKAGREGKGKTEDMRGVVDSLVRRRRKGGEAKLMRVQAHIGIAGNEKADEQAKKGTKQKGREVAIRSGLASLFLPITVGVAPVAEKTGEREFTRSYVDDFHSVISDKSLVALKRKIREHRRALRRDAEEEGFEMDGDKEETLVVGVKGPTYRLVGLRVDWELKFDEHFSNRLNLGKALWATAARLTRLAPAKRRQIYTGVARTVAMWGAWAWYDYAHGAPRERKLRELEKWQYKVARSITGAPWGTRRDVVEGLSNLESVETFVRWESTRVEARALRFEEERLREEDKEKVYLRGSLVHGAELPLAVLPSLHRGAEKEEWESHIRRNTEEGWIPVYTDGSLRGGKAGAGAWWGAKAKPWYLGEEATVNDAELVAISEVMGRVEGELLILTDSKHAIRRMRAVARGDTAHDGATYKLRKAWEERAGKGDLDVAVMWVKAHVGIEGNEGADRAAGWGTALQYKAEVVTEAGQRQRVRRERAEERNRLDLAYRPLERVGREIGRLAGLLGGKGLRAWRWKIGEGDGPECRWCGEDEETTDHLLRGCRVWKRRWPGGEEHVRRPPKRGEGERDQIEVLLAMLGE